MQSKVKKYDNHFSDFRIYLIEDASKNERIARLQKISTTTYRLTYDNEKYNSTVLDESEFKIIAIAVGVISKLD